MERMILSQKIINLSNSIGVDLTGFADATEFQDYLLKDSKRKNPKLSLSDAKSIIVIGIYIGGSALPAWDTLNIGRTSRLFLSGFFNGVVEKAKPIANFLHKEGYKAIICDDTESGESILPLKLSAIRAGFGWQGKNTLLINKKYGSFLALGGIITNAELVYNTQEEVNRCIHCNKCQQACPTNALEKDFVLNKGKCLSYLLQTENFPKEAESLIENRIIDCEICQQICPWNNRHIKQPLNTELTESFKNEVPRWEELFSISQLISLTELEYNTEFGYLNAEIPYKIFHRNVLMVYENYKRSKQLDNLG